MSKITQRLLLLAATTVLVGLVVELGYRAVRTEPPPLMYFRDGARRVVPDRPSPTEDFAFRATIQVPWPRPGLPAGLATTPAVGATEDWFGTGYAMPRDNLLGNVTWRPESRFFLCYRGPQQPYFDADGCVEMRFNRFGIRDRDDLTLAKPPGVRRVVCIGDSFTLGWGVRRDHNWPVLLEAHLGGQGHAVQVLNCGGTGSAYADEYELALRHRHGRFAPDVVVVTLCLNDLLVTNGKLCHFRPEALPDVDRPPELDRWWMHSAVLRDLGRRLAAAQALDLEGDVVADLFDLPADHVWYRNKGETPGVYWVSGSPQQALRGVRDWCLAHGARPLVVVWPLLQGLGPGRSYPFASLHRLVAEFCAAEAVPCLDLLPVLRDEPHENLWVSPGDMHPNERAQELVTPALGTFVAEALVR